MIKEKIDVLIREYRPDDKEFIFNTWTNNQASISPFNKHKKGEFCQEFKKLINYRLKHGEIEILVACNPEFEDQIYGFIVYTNEDIKTVHFAFVKSIYRENGIFTTLLKSLKFKPTHYSCLTTNIIARRFICKNKITLNLFHFFLGGTYELL